MLATIFDNNHFFYSKHDNNTNTVLLWARCR